MPSIIGLLRLSPEKRAALLSGNQAQAARWVQEAARQGMPEAQLRLGRMLLDGAGMARDPAAALRWFATAARDGDVEAMNMVGRCHENGWGTPAHTPTAALWYERAALRGDTWAQYNLGHLLLDGNGVAQDHAAAFAWYSRAAALGHPRAMNLVARCHEEGWGTARDPDQAAAFYRASAEYGYFRGQYNHATLLVAAGRWVEARTWFYRALAAWPAGLPKPAALATETGQAGKLNNRCSPSRNTRLPRGKCAAIAGARTSSPPV